MGKTHRINLQIDEDCDGPLYVALENLPPKKRASKIRLLALLGLFRGDKPQNVTGVTGMDSNSISNSYGSPATAIQVNAKPPEVLGESETSPGEVRLQENAGGVAEYMDFSCFGPGKSE